MSLIIKKVHIRLSASSGVILEMILIFNLEDFKSVVKDLSSYVEAHKRS